MADVDFAPPTLRVAAPKPKMTIYYALLIIALCAILVACLFMYLEIKRFGGFGTVKGKMTSTQRTHDSLTASGCGNTDSLRS